ncbi:MAG: hypothetical protein IT208_10915 [Chthonomonadales bacterium]|nr:hypothetical protein [Chthonomonadales bacterium]
MRASSGVHVRGRWLTAVAACAALALVGGSSSAASADAGEVAVGGERILAIRFPAAGMTVKERADAVTERLRVILSDPTLTPADIAARPSGRSAAIYVNGRLLVTVDPRTARYSYSKPLPLARQWVSHLRRVLPQVNVRPNPKLRDAAP